MGGKAKDDTNIKTVTITRKYQLIPADSAQKDEIYRYLRDGIYTQNKCYNVFMSNMYALHMANIHDGWNSDEFKKKLKDLTTHGSRNPKDGVSGWSLYEDITSGSGKEKKKLVFPVGLPIASKVQRHGSSDFKKAVRNGLLSGRSSLPTMKLDAPLWLSGQGTKIYHGDYYGSYENFLKVLMDGCPDIFVQIPHGYVLKVVLGNAYKSHNDRVIFQRIFEEQYKVGDSSIQICNGKIMFMLSLTIPAITDNHLDEDTVVGVDLGMAIPAMCALNNNEYVREKIDLGETLLRYRLKIKAMRKRFQQTARYNKGGHGRKRKLQGMDRFEKYEQNFARTFNHVISSRVINFALKNHAAQINIEYLHKDGLSKTVLGTWSYYQLQQDIKYKAEMHGIRVLTVNPYHTSQACSFCGSELENQRRSQSVFKCRNPKCKFFDKDINADFNAARNIAMSKDYIEKKDALKDWTVDEMKKRHEEYIKIKANV